MAFAEQNLSSKVEVRMGMVMKSIQKLSIVFDSFPPMFVGKIMATYSTYDDFQAS